jgi:hypothetical protein
MSKNRRSNRESKKEPVMTLKEKRAAKKSKNSDVAMKGIDKATAR